MRTLIQNRDLQRLFGGVSIVACAGLLMGAALHPNLDEDGLIAPQTLIPGGGPRAEAYVADPGLARYGGRVPDYVIGADYVRPPQLPLPAQQAGEEPQGDVMAYASDDEPAPLQAIRATWRDEPRQPVAYPSERGNVAYEANLPVPPAPPPADDEDVYSGQVLDLN